jgi:predicted TPR repeat methyltransferase
VYLGRLEEIISEAKRLLRPSGFLLFSVEALDELASDKIDSFEYKLNQTGRYAHSAKYLENLAYNNFFTIIGLSQAQLRVENKMPVIGWLALWKVTPH